VLLLAVLVEWTGARGDDWIPRTLDPLLHGSAPSHRPSRPKDRQQATPPPTVPASPAGEPSAPGEAPSPEPVRPTETAQPTPATQAGAAEASGDREPSAQPFAWKLAGFAAVALAVAALPFGIRVRRRGDLVVRIDHPPDQRGSFRVRVASSSEPKPSERRAASPGAASAVPTRESTRTERFQVEHEAQFSRLPPRSYWVIVEGELREPSGDRVTRHFAQRRVRIEPGRMMRVVFAFAPATSDPIEAARALLASGQNDLALARLDEALAGASLERASADVLALYAGLLADVGRVSDALAALDAARRREPALPHLATQIEELRKQAEDEAAAQTRAPSLAADRYEILEEVGRGGMAVVYRARDTRLGRIVALKRIADNLREHPQAVDMLLREARNAARLNHPHIVTVYDVDQDEDSYFITMEFLEGKALLGVLQRRGRFAPKRVLWLAKQVAAGLAYAHEQGVVHRDIKTANLFFVISTQTLKIMDFGLARIVEELRRRTTVIGGTPSYMSPEQAQGLAVDGRADLYAFGVTLFELLTGTLPFQGGDLVEQHRSAPVPDPRDRAVGIPDALAELVVHLLAKRPDDRPASAGEVAAKLRQIEGALG